MVFRYAFWILTVALTLISAADTAAQGHDILQGSVQNTKQEALAGATITLNGQQTTTSQADGTFHFSSVNPGKYTLTVSAVGYATHEQEVVKSAKQALQVNIVLNADVKQVSEVTVTGKTETQQVREQAIRAVVVDTRAVAEQPVTLNELINRSSGIRVRQSGGLGSTPDMSMNGFQGRAVRYFKDGIPLNYLAGGYGLHNIPINTLERVEVYKGVLPISLGADALGGAVNFVSRKQSGNMLHSSYEIASFNTHRFSINAYSELSKDFYTGTEAFYNYSDNNYRAFVMVPDPQTGNTTEQPVKLFHNGYRGVYGEAFIGLKDKVWADDLRFSLAYFSTENQQQHPALMTDPYGAIVGKQSSVVPTIRYQGTFFEDRLHIEQFAVLNTLNFNMVDTISGRYNWFGEFIPIANRTGEGSRPALSDIDIRQMTSRTQLSWQVSERQTLSANFVHTASRRIGQDPYAPRFAGTDIDALSVPAHYAKQVLGVGWDTQLSDKWEISAIGKWYRYESKGIETWGSRPIGLDEEKVVSQSYGGAGASVKYQHAPHTFARFSAEYAYRLPEVDELFGDAVWVVPNFVLTPEKSLNLNLGLNSRHENFSYEVNTFFRQTRDLIILLPILAPYAQFRNVNNVRGYGVEGDLSYQITPFLQGLGNFTWQSLRLFGFEANADKWRNGSRLQNTPYFFANAGLNASLPIGNRGNLISAYAFYNFVREFYLQTIPRELEAGGLLGIFGSSTVNSDVVIPDQHLLSAGINYRFASNRYTIGAEVKNIADSRLYDYFRVQRAGRSAHLKITYNIQQSK